jgi:hypothetical protein
MYVDWILAMEEICEVMVARQAVRDAGFDDESLQYPRSRLGLIALCAFNGIPVEKAPPGWKYWPNKGMKSCWERVIAAILEEGFKRGQADSDSRHAYPDYTGS